MKRIIMSNTLTIKQVAVKYRIPHSTIHNWVGQGKVDSITPGTPGGNPGYSGAKGQLTYHTLIEDNGRLIDRIVYRLGHGNSVRKPKRVTSQAYLRHRKAVKIAQHKQAALDNMKWTNGWSA